MINLRSPRGTNNRIEMKKLALGIDIGGTNTVLGLVDDEGNMYGESTVSTTKYPDFDDYLEEIYRSTQLLLKEVGTEYELAGIGIGAPNANYYSGNIEHAANLRWRGILPMVEKMKRYYPTIPVVMTNDANVAAVGEMIYGGAKGMKNFVVVTLGTGLGSGFVVNGQLVLGHDSFAGELGHVVVRRGGRACGCGLRGCLETYVSATGVVRTAFELMAEMREDSELRDIPFNQLTSEMIYNAAMREDPIALATFDYTSRILGQALADMVTITSPEAIFLFGGLAKAGRILFEPTKRYMEENMLFVYKNKVKLLPSGISGKNAAVLGASALVWQVLNEK